MQHYPETGCKDPIEVVLRQDHAFGPEIMDVDLWLSTLFFPLVMLSNEDTVLVETRGDAVRWLNAVGRAVRATGVVGIRTRILSNFLVEEDLAMVSTLRDRIGADGGVMASTSITWTITRLGPDWKARSLLFDERRADPSVTFGPGVRRSKS